MRPLFLLILLLISPVVAVAQHSQNRILGPIPSQVLWTASQGPLRQPLTLDTIRREIRPTHWKEGAAIGGAAAGLGLALLVAAFCGDTDSGGDCGSAIPTVFLAGVVPGGILGALIGGMFPKDESF